MEGKYYLGWLILIGILAPILCGDQCPQAGGGWTRSITGSCSFQNGTCGYTLGTDWVLTDKPYVYTSHGHSRTIIDGGVGDDGYVTMDNFGVFLNTTHTNPSVFTSLTSPTLPAGNYCLSFSNIIFGNHPSFEVIIVDEVGKQNAIYTSPPGSAIIWASVALQISSNTPFKIVFISTTGRSRMVAIDNISLMSSTRQYSTSWPWSTTQPTYPYWYGTTAHYEGEIRLVNGWSYQSGRVEVFHRGAWGTVCDDAFDHNDVIVICKQLGYYHGDSYGKPYSNAHFGEGRGSIVIDDLACYGYESTLKSCPSTSWGNHDCSHSEDAGVDCAGYYDEWTTTTYASWTSTEESTTTDSYFTSSDYYREGDIRLVNGASYQSGRVEVFHRGAWGTVCDDGFDHSDVIVICKQLGYYHGDSYGRPYSMASFGEGRGSIVIDNLACYGHESTVKSCPSNPWGDHNCNHNEDAGVDCSAYYGELNTTTMDAWTTTNSYYTSAVYHYEGDLRLVNGTSPYSGRVEVFHNGRWGTVCDDNFDHYDVIVICRQLGYYIGSSYGVAYSGASFGQGYGPINVDELRCSGSENTITQCLSNTWGTHDCGHSEDAGVDCHAYIGTTPWWRNGTTWYRTTHRPTNTPSRTTSYWHMTTRGYAVTDAIHAGCNDQGWDIRVKMNLLRQMYPDAKATDIYLGENSCSGYEYFGELVFQQGLRDCLTSETVRNGALVYQNEIVYAQHDPLFSFIIRNYNWTVSVECDVMRNETTHGHIHHDPLNHATSGQVAGTSHYNVNMSFYLDPNFVHPVPGNPLHVPVGTQVYVKVYTTISDWTIKMRVHTCYTKPATRSPDHLTYYLIKDGCETDANTHLLSQSSHETRFVFQDFEYTSTHEGIEVMCDATFCSSHDYSQQCTQACNP